MELTISRDALLNAVGRLVGVTNAKHTIPILSHALIGQRNARLRLSATDLEIGISTYLDLGADDNNGEFATTVNARKLHEILRATEDEEVTLRTPDGDHIAVASGRFKAKLNSLDPRSFPALPDSSAAKDVHGKITLDAAVLRTMIDRTIFAVSPDESRYNLSGIYLEMPEEGTIRCVSTDGHRLALADSPAGGVELDAVLAKGVLLPRKGVQEARKLLEGRDGQVTLFIHDGGAFLAVGDTSLSMRLIEGEFPDYAGVIPPLDRYKVRFAVDAAAIKAATSRARLFSNEKFAGVKLACAKGGPLAISSSSPETGEASDEVEIGDYNSPDADPTPIEVSLNARYLLDVLGVINGPLEFNFIDSTSPILVTLPEDATYRYIIMPMRL